MTPLCSDGCHCRAKDGEADDALSGMGPKMPTLAIVSDQAQMGDESCKEETALPQVSFHLNMYLYMHLQLIGKHASFTTIFLLIFYCKWVQAYRDKSLRHVYKRRLVSRHVNKERFLVIREGTRNMMCGACAVH